MSELLPRHVDCIVELYVENRVFELVSLLQTISWCKDFLQTLFSIIVTMCTVDLTSLDAAAAALNQSAIMDKPAAVKLEISKR